MDASLRKDWNPVLHTCICRPTHTYNRVALLFCLPLYTSLSVSLSLSICSAESYDQERVHTSPLQLPWDKRGGGGERRKGWEIELVRARSLSLSHALSVKPPHRHQQLLATTANSFFFPCAYMWYSTDWKVLSLAMFMCQHSDIYVCLRSWISALAALGGVWDQHLV